MNLALVDFTIFAFQYTAGKSGWLVSVVEIFKVIAYVDTENPLENVVVPYHEFTQSIHTSRNIALGIHQSQSARKLRQSFEFTFA
jgi:hypothetical protein